MFVDDTRILTTADNFDQCAAKMNKSPEQCRATSLWWRGTPTKN